MLAKLKAGNLHESLAYSQFGSHVIEKLICSFQRPEVEFVYRFVLKNLLVLSKDNNSLCVVKAIVTQADKPTKAELKVLLERHFSNLVHNKYGNYVLQRAFEVNRLT